MNYTFTQRKMQRVTDKVKAKTGLRFSPSGGGDIVGRMGVWSAVSRGVRYSLSDKPGYYVQFDIRFDPPVEGVPDFSVDVGKHFSVEDTARQIVGFVGAFLAPCGIKGGTWDEPYAAWEAGRSKDGEEKEDEKQGEA